MSRHNHNRRSSPRCCTCGRARHRLVKGSCEACRSPEGDSDDRDAALARARLDLPKVMQVEGGWRAAAVQRIEVLGEGAAEVVEEWEVSGACEACNRTLFDAEGHHGEDCDLCDSCFEAAKAEAIAEHIAARRRETGQELSAEEAWDQMRAEVEDA
jgi:hypothetical protein